MMASHGRRVGLSNKQSPQRLLSQIGGRSRSAYQETKKTLDDIEDSQTENRLPKTFKSVDDDPLSTDNSDNSNDSDDGRTSRANIGRSLFIKGKSATQERQQKPKQAANRPQKRIGPGTSLKDQFKAESAKRKRLDFSDHGGQGEDDDDDDIPKKKRSTSSDRKPSSRKQPPSSSSGSHHQDEHGFVKKQKGQRTFGAKNSNRQTLSGPKTTSKPESKGKSAFIRSDSVADDIIDTPRKDIKFKDLDEPGSSNPESPRKRFNNVSGSEEQSPDEESHLLRKSELTPRPKSKKLKNEGKEKAKRKSKRQEKEEGEPTPKAIFKVDFDSQDPEPLGEEGDVDLDGDLSEAEGDEKDGAKDDVPQFRSFGGTDDDDDPAPVSLCPWCGEPVDEKLLKEFSKGQRMNVRLQTRFCQRHKRDTAMEAWALKAYPAIDWDSLPQRIETHHDSLLDIVDGQESYYRSRLAEKINAGEARSMRKEENLNPGYYGPRGFNLMCDRLVQRFSSLLKEKAVKDRVISGRGSAAFIQSVLVAELATFLIMEDMGVPYDEARDIMEESKAIGEIVCEET